MFGDFALCFPFPFPGVRCRALTESSAAAVGGFGDFGGEGDLVDLLGVFRCGALLIGKTILGGEGVLGATG